MPKIKPLMIYQETENEVMVKLPNAEKTEIKKAVWLAKNQIEIDINGKNVLSVAAELIKQYKLPQLSNKWKQMQVDTSCLVKKYEKGTMFKMPPGGEYAGYVFFHPNNLVRLGKRRETPQSITWEKCYDLNYTDSFSFVLKNADKSFSLSGDKLLGEFDFANNLPKYENEKKYLQNCPSVLKSERNFVCLRLTWDSVKQKWAKMPINPHTGGQAQVNNPDTWGSFEETTTAIDKLGIRGGIGYILTGKDNIVGIDLDLLNGELTEKGKAILNKMKGKTYIEYSASGAVHIFGFAKKPGTWTRGVGDSNLEMYGSNEDGNRSLMLTGNVLGENMPIKDIQADIDSIYKDYFYRPEVIRDSTTRREGSLSEREIMDKIQASKSARKFDLLMSGSIMEYGDYSSADLAFCSIVAFFTDDRNIIDNIYRQSNLYTAEKLNTETGRMESRALKWDSQRRTGTYGQETIDYAMKHVFKTYSPSGLEKIEPLMIYRSTEKAVMVKLPNAETPSIKNSVWLAKSRIELDKDGKRVIAADKRIAQDKQIPLLKRIIPALRK